MAMRGTFKVMLALALAAAAQSADAKTLVGEYSGDSGTNTPTFEVSAPWIMDWLVSGDPGEYEVVDMSLVNADTGAFQGSVLKSKNAGNGVRLFKQGGRYYFRVEASMMHWDVKVYQLTSEEAKAYKPKSDTLLGE